MKKIRYIIGYTILALMGVGVILIALQAEEATQLRIVKIAMACVGIGLFFIALVLITPKEKNKSK